MISTSSDDEDFKTNLLKQLDERNAKFNKVAHVVEACIKLQIDNDQLQEKNIELEEKYKKLQYDYETTKQAAGLNKQAIERGEYEKSFDQKLIKAQEALVEMQAKNENRIQQIANLNIALREYGEEKKTLCDDLQEKTKALEEVKNENENLKTQLKGVIQAKETILDEHHALLLANNVTEEKLRNIQSENQDLITKLLTVKAVAVDDMNRENLTFQKNRHERMKAALQDAMTDNESPTTGTETSLKTEISAPTEAEAPKSFLQRKFQNFLTSVRKNDEEQVVTSSPLYSPAFSTVNVQIPQQVLCKWKAHESEVTATRFSSTAGGLLATGGLDKLVNIWNFVGDKQRLQGTLRGFHGGITSIDFDPEEIYILASSNDCAIRMWLAATQRVKLTLTGHGGKVLSCRFLGSSNRIATGSHDRTVKIWDSRSGACQRTLMAGSSCNDVISADFADCVVSGHFDKKIRVWDTRSNHGIINEISVGGRVTSLDMPNDMKSLVCCTKDHTLELVDLRKSNVKKVFCHDSFKVSTDQTRCCFSPDGQYVAVGSLDGGVFTWDVQTEQLVSLQYLHSDPVINCNWKCGKLVTGDKNKMCVVWQSTG